MKEEIRELVKEWVRKADRNLIAAKHELTQKDPITEDICFNCQQAIEKYLKAFLVAQQIYFNKTHDIKELLALCIKEDSNFESLFNANIEMLTDYAIEIRYPGFSEEPSREEAAEAIVKTERVKEFVYNVLRQCLIN